MKGLLYQEHQIAWDIRAIISGRGLQRNNCADQSRGGRPEQAIDLALASIMQRLSLLTRQWILFYISLEFVHEDHLTCRNSHRRRLYIGISAGTHHAVLGKYQNRLVGLVGGTVARPVTARWGHGRKVKKPSRTPRDMLAIL